MVSVAISAAVWDILRFIPSDVGSGAVGWEVGVSTLRGGLSVTVGVAGSVSDGRLLSGSSVVKCLSFFACVFTDGLT